LDVGAAEWAYPPLEILIRSLVRRIARSFARPFEAVRADDGVSRRDECISTGRVSPGSAPRGPGDLWGPFSEVVIFCISVKEVLRPNNSEIPNIN